MSLSTYTKSNVKTTNGSYVFPAEFLIQQEYIAKKRISSVVSWILLVVVILTGLLVPARVQAQYLNVPITGFNADIVAEGTAGATATVTTTDNVDGSGAGANFVFVTPTFRPSAAASACSPSNGWPASVTSSNVANSTGITYPLQSATGNNSLRLASTLAANLTLATPLSASVLYLVCLGGNGAAAFTAKVNFSDNTSETVVSSAPDWCGGAATSRVNPNIYYRIDRTVTSCTGTTCQYMYEVPIVISPANYTKSILSITLTNTGGSTVYLHVLAVGCKATCAIPADGATGLTGGSITTGSIPASFTAASSSPSGYLVVTYPSGATPVVPVSGTVYTANQALGTGKVLQASNALSFTSNGLSGSTTYDFYIYSYNTGATCGGPVYNTSNVLSGSLSTLACSGLAGGTYTVGPSGTYASLTAALLDINPGVTGPVIFELMADYSSVVETFPIVFNYNPCLGPVNNLTIRPATGATALAITSANVTGTVNFNGASYVTIDGRPGGTGVVSQLSISNTNAGTSYGVQFAGDASSNAIKFCTISSRNTSVLSGTIVFGSGTANGNDNNTIDNCSIIDGTSTPLNAIYSAGTSSTIDNSGNVITNNNIANYFGVATASNGILIASNSAGWVISGNRFYQTATRTATTGTQNRAIQIISATGGGYTINNNVIGYSNASGTGNTIYTGGASGFVGIEVSAAVSPVSNIQGNTVSNISVTSTGAGSATAPIFGGIQLLAGSYNIGTVTGNVIGAATGVSSINVSSSANFFVNGIYVSSTGSNNIVNNRIGAITAAGSAAAIGSQFYGIWALGSAANYTINSNVIGSTSTANSIVVGNDLITTAASAAQNFYGIRCDATGNVVVGASGLGNTVQNIALRSSSSAAFYGYYLGSAALSAGYNYNTLSAIAHGFTTTSATGNFYGFYNASTLSGALSISNNSFTGISNLNTNGTIYVIYNSNATNNATVSNNTFSNVTRLGTLAGSMYGYYNFGSPTGGTATFSSNNFSTVSAGGSSSTLYGIYTNTAIAQSLVVTSNSFTSISSGTGGGYALDILLGTSATISTNTINGFTSTGTIYGIYSTGGATLNNISSNTISGLNTTGSSAYGIYTSGTNANLSKNKVYDLLSTSTSGIVYGIYTAGGTVLNISNNLVGDLRATSSTQTAPTPSVIGLYLSSGTTINAYYNSFNISATGGTNFGTAAVYASSSPSTVNLRNNIFSNSSTASGTGKTVAYQRAAVSLTNYAATSNNNAFYAGTPGATNVVYFDGTNSDQTLSAFKLRMATRDGQSVSENPPFLSLSGASSDFLHISPTISTQLESGAAPITLFTDDFDGTTRNVSTPDIGADEFTGVRLVTVLINTVSASPLGNQCTATPRTISANVTAGGSNISSVTLNYSFNGAAPVNVVMTGGSVTANSTSTWTGIIPAATPANASVTWSVTATDPVTSKVTTGASYSDEPLFGVTATASASPTTFCAGSPTSLSVAVSLGASPTYTAPPAVSSATTDEDLGNVTITQGATTILNNTSARNSLTGTIGVATGTAGSYSNFTAFGPYAVNAGQTYNFSISSLQNTTAYSNAMAIYIDYNRDGLFSGANELVYTSAATTSGAHTETGSFTIPASASFGLTRMRVISNEGLVTGPTQSLSYGEYEEYTLNILGYTYTWNDGTSNVGTGNPYVATPLTTTTYTATVTLNGCGITSSSITVFPTALPAAPSTAPSTQCGVGTPPGVLANGSAGSFVWYTVPTGGTALSGQTTGSLVSYPISTTTTFYVATTNGICESNRTPVVATVLTPDPLTASSNGPVCANSPLTLTATVPSGANSNTYTYSWTANPATGSGIPTSVSGGTGSFGSPANTIVTPTAGGTYTYTVTGTDGACTNVSTVTVLVNALPVIDSVRTNLATVCANTTVTLNGYSSLVGTGSQTPASYTAPPAISNPLIDEDFGNITITRGATTILNNTTTGGSLIGTIGTATGTAGSYSNFTAFGPFVLNRSFVYNLSLTSITQGTINYGNAMAVWIDYNRNGSFGDAGEQVYNQGATIVGPHTSTGTFTVPAGATLGVARMRVLVNEGAVTGPTMSSSYGEYEEYLVDIRSLNTQNPNLTYSWTPGPLTGATVTATPSTTTIYTLVVTNPLTGCSSTGSNVTVNVNPVPPAPTGTNSSQCGAIVPSASVTSTSGDASPNFNWYTVATNGTPVQSGPSATYTTIVTSTTTFYVSEVSGFSCEGERTPVTVTVATPDELTASATQTLVCPGTSTSISSAYTPFFNSFQTFDLTATGGAASGVTGTISLSPNANGSDPYVITPTAAGTYTYTITAYDPESFCTSIGSVTVTANVNPVITAVSANPATICAGAPVTLTAIGAPQFANVAVTGYNVDAVANGVGPVSSSTTGDLDNVYTYGAADWNFDGTCAPLAFFMPVSGKVPGNSTVAPGIVYTLQPYSGLNTLRIPASGTGTTGTGTLTLTTPTQMNTLYLLYGAGNGPITSGITVTVTFTDATTEVFSNLTAKDWFATTTPAISNLGRLTRNPVTPACATTVTSGPQMFDLALPLSAGNYTKSVQSIKVDKTITTGIMNIMGVAMKAPASNFQTSPYSWQWNPGSLPDSVVTVNPTVTTTYTATLTNPATGCSVNSAPVTVTVNPLPALPTAPNVSRCGPGAITLNATGTGLGILHWYNVATGGTSIQTGGTFTTTVSVTNTSFWVSETSEAGCEGPRKQVVITVTPPPALSIVAAGPTTFCQPGSVVLTAGGSSTYVNFTWTAVPSVGSGLSSASGASVTAAPTVAGTYTYTLTADDGGSNGCSNNTSVTVVMNANPVITSATASASPICAGATSTLTATSVNAVTGTVTVGSGTNVQATNTTIGAFYGLYYGNGHAQVLFRAAELTAAGLTPGNITSLGVNVASIGNGSALNGYTIKIASTAATAITTFQAPAFTTVFGPTNYNPTVGVNTHNFIAPFVWNGTSNIIVDYCFSTQITGTATTAVTNSYTTTSFGSFVNYQVDGAAGAAACTTTTVSNTSSDRPNLIFGGQIGTVVTNTLNWVWNPGALIGSTVIVTPAVTTTYTVQATNSTTGCVAVSSPVTVTVTPVGANATASPSTPVCAGTSVTLNGGATGGGPFSYSWNNGTSNFSVLASPVVNPTVNTTYTVTVTDNCGNTATSAVTVNVTPLPTASILESNPITLCSPSTQVLTAVTNASSATYQWTLNNNNIAGATGATYTVSGIGTGNYRVIVTNTITGCASAASTRVNVTINYTPTNVTAAASSATICNGGSTNLTSGADAVPLSIASTLLSQNFETGIGGWVSINNTTTTGSGNPALTAWTIVPNPYTSANTTPVTFTGGSGNSFILTNSDIGGSGTSVSTLLESPSFSSVGYGALSLSVREYFRLLTSGEATIQVSTNNGTSWTTVKTYTATTGTETAFASNTVDLSAYIGNPSVKVRFSYIGGWAWYWALDNISVTGIPSLSYNWSSVPAGFTSTLQNPTGLTPSVTTTYTVTVSTLLGCPKSASTTVTVNPRPTGVISGGATYCGAATATSLNIAVTGSGPWVGTLSDGTAFSGSTSPLTVNVTPTTTTTYTIATLSGSLCTSTAADLSGTATVTINPTPATPGITPAGPITQCGGTVLLTSTSATGNQWSVGGSQIPSATSSTYLVTTSGVYSVVVTNGFGCSSLGSAPVTVTINPVPETPIITANGALAFCAGGSVTLSSSSATGNQWSVGGSPIPGATGNSLVVTTSGSYTVVVTNGFGCSSTPSLATAVTVNPLAAAPTASVVQPTCAVATGTINVTSPLGAGNSYSLDGVTFQSGTSFPGQLPGTYTVYVRNSFGCFAPATANVTVNAQPFTPTSPVVTGLVNVCPFIGTTQQITYHATTTGNGTTTFTWVIPPTNVTIVSGQGTADLTLTFQNGFALQANKQLRLTATNQCGTSPLSIFYLVAQIPTTPNPITGPTDACPLLGGAAVTYTIPAAPGAASYIWTAQAGTTTITHPNGLGANDTTITVAFAAGFSTSAITVQSVNDCGVSGVRSITVTRTAPSTPSLISGPTNACEYLAPTGTAATYTVPQVAGVTYTWTVPAGSTGVTAQGSNTISFIYPSGFTSGSVSVTATSGCGTSAPRSLAVSKLNVATPNVIDVIQTGFCEDAGGRVYTYTVSPMPANAISVQWMIPAGAILVNGQGTTSITVSYPSTSVSGAVTAQGVNNCSVSTIRSTPVRLPACPPPGFTAGKVSVTPKADLMEVKIFPNPTVSDFKLEVLTSGKEEITVRVLDAQGRLYKNFKLLPYQTIGLGAELKAGSYLIEVRQGTSVKTTKVIKF